MNITVNRAQEPIKGTFWRPIKHTVHQRGVIESVRRETPVDWPDKIIQRPQGIELKEIDLLLAGLRNEYTPARIEDSFKKGRYKEGYVYVASLAAFVHEDEVERFKAMPDQISPGAIISKAVRIEEGAHIGPYVELERGVRVKSGASVGASSVVRKGAHIEADARVGDLSYIGQFSRVGRRAVVGSMSVMERRTGVGPDVEIGRQGRLGVRSYVATQGWLDDSVRLGRHVYTGRGVSIGEMTSIGDYSHIADGSMIGAESRFGRFVRVAKNVILISPTIAEDGALLLESNMFAPKPIE